MIDHMRMKYWKYNFRFLLFTIMPFLFFPVCLSGQLKGNCESCITDTQNNFFCIENNEVVKYNVEQEELYRYSNKALGTIFSIDAINPLRPILFYKESQHIVITDNTLSSMNDEVISLEPLGLYQTQLIASSRMDDGIWLFDQANFQLIKLDKSFQIVFESGNLEQILGKEDLNPIQMIEKHGLLYMLTAKYGFLVFDIYGTFHKSIPLIGITSFSIKGDYLFYLIDKKVSVLNTKTQEIGDIKLTEEINSILDVNGSIMLGCVRGNILSQVFSVE